MPCTEALPVTQQFGLCLALLACFDMCLVCKIKVINLMQCIMHIVLIILPDLNDTVVYCRLLQYAYLGALWLPIGGDGTAARLRRMIATQCELCSH